MGKFEQQWVIPDPGRRTGATPQLARLLWGALNRKDFVWLPTLNEVRTFRSGSSQSTLRSQAQRPLNLGR